ncbi:hypothetical protein PGT21_013521 [Puccinia graminis f. sp. tritici]|uniref:Uncharacterized protein n=1 Tax=Puccinia graminis f. sp. tritici TaxID=56615 RepID=A0A5B0PVR5_PUCGR|nr:hypothetical protein PGTUg99_037033 [Puccinia graminis f. sp. tritici]KAA1104169.1 hypothetical protein PGT21_013521 [Puccinia graminis f. sp. tritici]
MLTIPGLLNLPSPTIFSSSYPKFSSQPLDQPALTRLIADQPILATCSSRLTNLRAKGVARNNPPRFNQPICRKEPSLILNLHRRSDYV